MLPIICPMKTNATFKKKLNNNHKIKFHIIFIMSIKIWLELSYNHCFYKENKLMKQMKQTHAIWPAHLICANKYNA